MNDKQKAEHSKLLSKWAIGTLNRAGILRCMVLSQMAKREAQDAFAAACAARRA